MISEILFTILEGLIIFTAFALLSNHKKFLSKSCIKLVTFVFIYTVFTYWITLFIPRGLHSIVIVSFNVITLSFIYNGSLVKSFLKNFLIFVAMSIIETLIGIFAMLVTNISLNDIVDNNFYMLICSIISKVIELMIVYLLYRIDFNISWLNDRETQHSSRFNQILIVITSIIFLMIGTSVYISNNPQKLPLFYVFSFVIYIVMIIAVVFAFQEGSKLQIIQFASEATKRNIQQLIEFNEMVAKERHEYKNHLNTIYGLCTMNKPDLSEKIKLYINSYANNSDTRNIVIDSGNDFVDAIINVKYNNALQKGIEVLADFEVPLSAARIDEHVAVTIISNIIENAFESIVTVEQEKKYINIQTYIENNTYYISISNNGPMITETDKKKIFNAGFSTKDNITKKRGFGLSIVHTEVERCGGIISINSTEEVTEFLISLKVNEQQAVV